MRNWVRTRSVMLNHFSIARSVNAYPGARKFEKYRGAFPNSPAGAATNAQELNQASTVRIFAGAIHVAFPVTVPGLLGFPTIFACWLPPNRLAPFTFAWMAIGEPCLNVLMVESCHPPRTALVNLLKSAPNLFPLPTGNSYMKLTTAPLGTSNRSTDFSARRS